MLISHNKSAEVVWFWCTVFTGGIADSKDGRDDVSSHVHQQRLYTTTTTSTVCYVESENSIFALQTSRMWQRSTAHTSDFNQSLSRGRISAIQIPPTDTQKSRGSGCAVCTFLFRGVMFRIKSFLPACPHGRAAAFYDETDTKVNLWIGKKTLPLICGPFSTHCSKRGKISLQPLATTVTKAADCWCIIHSHCTII